MPNNAAKILPFIKRELPPIPTEDVGRKDELQYVFIVYCIDAIKKTREVVHVCSRYDFAVNYIETRSDTEYKLSYEAEGWPLDWYEQMG
jgi:hypothetical protein